MLFSISISASWNSFSKDISSHSQFLHCIVLEFFCVLQSIFSFILCSPRFFYIKTKFEDFSRCMGQSDLLLILKSLVISANIFSKSFSYWKLNILMASCNISVYLKLNLFSNFWVNLPNFWKRKIGTKSKCKIFLSDSLRNKSTLFTFNSTFYLQHTMWDSLNVWKIRHLLPNKRNVLQNLR